MVMKSAVKMETGSKVGSVGLTKPKAGMKTGAKQTDGQKFWKNKDAAARRVAVKVSHGKSGLPSGATAKGKNVFKATEQATAFTNPAGVMKQGAGFCKFVS